MTKPLKTTILCLAAVGLVSGLAGLGVALSKRAQTIQDQLASPVSVNYGSSSASSDAASISSDPGGSSAPVDSSPTETSETGTPVLALSTDALALTTTSSGVMPSSTISCHVSGVSNNKVVWSVADPSLVMISKTLTQSDELVTVSLVKAFYGTTKLTAMSLLDSTVYKTCVVSWENPITSITIRGISCYYNGSYKGNATVNTANSWTDASYGSLTSLNFTEEQSALVTSPEEALTARNCVTVTGVTYTDFNILFRVRRMVADSTNSHLDGLSTDFRDAANSVAGNTTVSYVECVWDSAVPCWQVTLKVHCSGTTTAGHQMLKIKGFYYCVNIGAK